MINMKGLIGVVLSLCVCVAMADEKPSPEALVGRFGELLQSMTDNNAEVIQATSSIKDEKSLKQACEIFRKLYDRLEQMSGEIQAFKNELEQLGVKLFDLPNAESLMSDFRYRTLLQRTKLLELKNVLDARLERGELGDPAQAVELVGLGIPVFFNNYEDVDRKHADTAMRIQQFVAQSEMAISEFSSKLMAITDAESAQKAADFVVSFKPLLRDLQMKMDMYAWDDPAGYEPIREAMVARVVSINDEFISVIQNVFMKDCFGCKALQDYLAPTEE